MNEEECMCVCVCVRQGSVVQQGKVLVQDKVQLSENVSAPRFKERRLFLVGDKTRLDVRFLVDPLSDDAKATWLEKLRGLHQSQNDFLKGVTTCSHPPPLQCTRRTRPAPAAAPSLHRNIQYE